MCPTLINPEENLVPLTRNKVFVRSIRSAKLIGWADWKKFSWFKKVRLIGKVRIYSSSRHPDHWSKKPFCPKNLFLGLKGTGNGPLETRKSMKTLTKQRVWAKRWIHLQSKITKNYWKPLVKQAFVKVKGNPFSAKPWKHWGKLGILIKTESKNDLKVAKPL